MERSNEADNGHSEHSPMSASIKLRVSLTVYHLSSDVCFHLLSAAHLPLLISTQVITGSASARDLTTDDCLRGMFDALPYLTVSIVP